MASVNLVMISGKLESNPTIKGNALTFKLTNKEKFGDKEVVTTIDVVTFDKLKDACAGLKANNRVFVEGKLKHQSKELPSGKKHYWSEIVAKKIDFIG